MKQKPRGGKDSRRSMNQRSPAPAGHSGKKIWQEATHMLPEAKPGLRRKQSRSEWGPSTLPSLTGAMRLSSEARNDVQRLQGRTASFLTESQGCLSWLQAPPGSSQPPPLHPSLTPTPGQTPKTHPLHPSPLSLPTQRCSPFLGLEMPTGQLVITG